MPEHTLTLEQRPDAALAALRRAADDWGAELRKEESGLWLYLPVVHGLRRGLIAGPVQVEPAADGSRIVFRPEDSDLKVQVSPVIVLLLAVGGGVLTMLWPFFPDLLPLAPFGAILALGGWFLVLSRLRTSGAEEFLGTVGVEAEAGAPARSEAS
ncbi:MAG TPA: hypothetical protein VNM67_03195 [Thermoanaerobaculia bacterium]|nr:hypothetical protein [Thermoanaerobaculia bacterium]